MKAVPLTQRLTALSVSIPGSDIGSCHVLRDKATGDWGPATARAITRRWGWGTGDKAQTRGRCCAGESLGNRLAICHVLRDKPSGTGGEHRALKGSVAP